MTNKILVGSPSFQEEGSGLANGAKVIAGFMEHPIYLNRGYSILSSERENGWSAYTCNDLNPACRLNRKESKELEQKAPTTANLFEGSLDAILTDWLNN